MSQAPVLSASAPDRCDVRVSWVLTGAQRVYASPEWQRHTETSLPASVVAHSLGKMAKAQAAENVQAALFRSKADFGLQN